MEYKKVNSLTEYIKELGDNSTGEATEDAIYDLEKVTMLPEEELTIGTVTV